MTHMACETQQANHHTQHAQRIAIDIIVEAAIFEIRIARHLDAQREGRGADECAAAQCSESRSVNTVGRADSIFRRDLTAGRRRRRRRAAVSHSVIDSTTQSHHPLIPKSFAMPWDFVSVYKTKCLDFQVDARDVIINALELEQLRCMVS